MDPQQGQKLPLESLGKEEIINKYKSLLNIAKKAKLAKDEMSEENRKLKEQIQQCETQKDADKTALITMKEMLEVYTENKLELTTKVSELEKRRKTDGEQIEKLSIENESLKRQLDRLTDDNDSLLTDIENMEGQLQQVSGLGKEQKQHLVLLEQEVKQLKEAKVENQELITINIDLVKSLDELKEKYSFIKEVNSEQRQKFNMLKDRFLDVHKKLKKLKECKRILLETQHEYADSVSQWQMEIIKASKLLCKEIANLKLENTQLLEKLNTTRKDNKNQISLDKLIDLLHLSEKAKIDYNYLQKENVELRQKISQNSGLNIKRERLDKLCQLSNLAFQEHLSIQQNYLKLKNESNIIPPQAYEMLPNIVPKLEELKGIADKAEKEYQLQSQEMATLRHDYEVLKNKSITDIETALEEQKEYHILEGKNNLNDSKNIASEKLENDIKELALENCKLQQHIQELSSSSQQESDNLCELKHNLSKCQQTSDEYHQMYKQKEREHYELLDEMRELNEALKARGDLISRQQEDHHLLKTELTNNVEKLQKMQEDFDKKDQELCEKQFNLDTATKTVEETKHEIDALKNASSLNEEKIRVLSTELDNIRCSQNNADLDNQSEILSTSTISRADELQRLKDVEDSFEDKYNKLRGLAAKLKKKLQDEIATKQQLEKELRDLKAHESETTAKLNDLQTTINEVESLRNQLSEKQKQLDVLKIENQKLKSSRKQANVLNLEIEAAEKSLTEVSNKLATRTSELDGAQESLKTKDSSISQLRKEIELLESSKSAEMKHSQDLKDQIDHLQATLKDAVHSKQQAFDRTEILEQDVENLKLELESVRVELANATCNLEKSLSTLKTEKEQLSAELFTAQSALSECEQKLMYADRANEDLRVEYLDYKVKAQAVLRKNQNRDSTKERELEEEILAIRATETQLKATIDTLSTKLQVLEKEKELISDDSSRHKKRTVELMQLIEEMRVSADALNLEVQKQIQQQHETLKQHRQQIESMDECHKEQIKSINTNNLRQLDQLRKELSVNVRLAPIVGATKSSALIDHHLIEQTKLDYLLMEREDAEGSEEAAETLATLAASRKISNDSSSTKRSHHDFMPLDELLNTPINAISSETLITAPIHNISDHLGNSSDLLQLELNSTKERLQKQESGVRHLTALLAENEQDLAKLTQMNDMLKEELRRQERCVEREQHMHNSEYIKNVIMKFLTLNNADEKTRLVPVLNTILKLSRPETEMLNCVAKGQKVSEATPRGGWGNFLPWGGGSGSSNN